MAVADTHLRTAGCAQSAFCLPSAEEVVRNALSDTEGVVSTLVSGIGCGAHVLKEL